MSLASIFPHSADGMVDYSWKYSVWNSYVNFEKND